MKEIFDGKWYMLPVAKDIRIIVRSKDKDTYKLERSKENVELELSNLLYLLSMSLGGGCLRTTHVYRHTDWKEKRREFHFKYSGLNTFEFL